MLLSMDDFENYRVQAIDGPIGHVRDLYFDDDAWVVRYLVVETGSWPLATESQGVEYADRDRPAEPNRTDTVRVDHKGSDKE